MSASKKAAKPAARPVIVTTKHRGVFFGYAEDTTGEVIELTKARLCLYWSADVKGFMGLASTGPTSKCRIGPPADIQVRKITAVLEVTAEATAKWESAPWG
jgi:hypothetical protein